MTGQKERIDAIREMYAHGRGRVVMRARARSRRRARAGCAIVVTELPYQVNKATLVEKIADLVKGKKIEGIADLRDESDRDGMRLVIECKRDASAAQGAQQPVQAHRAATRLQHEHAGAGRRPAPDAAAQGVLQHYIDWRREVVRRRTEFDLGKARERAHILEGLKIALDNLDAVIRTIRESADAETRAQNLIARFEPDRDPGQRHPRDAAPPPGRAGAQEDRGRVPGDDQAHRRLEDILANPARVLRDHQGRAQRALGDKYAGDRLTRVEGDSIAS